MYLGDLGDDTAATARDILAKVPTPDNAVLLAVSPNQKAIEVVYGSEVKGRGIEEAAPLGVSAAAASFKEGNLIDGLISAVRVLSAGVSPPEPLTPFAQRRIPCRQRFTLTTGNSF